jgi:hypothetical protein
MWIKTIFPWIFLNIHLVVEPKLFVVDYLFNNQNLSWGVKLMGASYWVVVSLLVAWIPSIWMNFPLWHLIFVMFINCAHLSVYNLQHMFTCNVHPNQVFNITFSNITLSIFVIKSLETNMLSFKSPQNMFYDNVYTICFNFIYIYIA